MTQKIEYEVYLIKKNFKILKNLNWAFENPLLQPSLALAPRHGTVRRGAWRCAMTHSTVRRRRRRTTPRRT